MVRVYLGTMTFGWSQASRYVDSTTAAEMVRKFVAFGGTRIDTARIYAGGATEPIVSAAVQGYRDKLTIGSKAHPSQPGGLSDAGLRNQVRASALFSPLT